MFACETNHYVREKSERCHFNDQIGMKTSFFLLPSCVTDEKLEQKQRQANKNDVKRSVLNSLSERHTKCVIVMELMT